MKRFIVILLLLSMTMTFACFPVSAAGTAAQPKQSASAAAYQNTPGRESAQTLPEGVDYGDYTAPVPVETADPALTGAAPGTEDAAAPSDAQEYLPSESDEHTTLLQRVFRTLQARAGALADDTQEPETDEPEETAPPAAAWEFDAASATLRISGPGVVADCASSAEAPWAEHAEEIRAIVVSDGVTAIGKFAFSDLTELQTVELADSVASLGFRCFADCYELTSVRLPQSWNECPADDGTTSNVDHRGQIFSGCESLKSLALPEGSRTVPAYAFNGCEELEQILLPDSIDTIGNHAFYNCSALRSITVPEGVRTLEKSTFCCCYGLTDVTLPERLEVLKPYVFYDCESLTEIELPDAVTSIGFQCFADCGALENVRLPRSWSECPSYDDSTINTDHCGQIFSYCNALREITVPEGMTQLPGYAFNKAYALERVTLPESLTIIGNHAFFDCSALKEINIPSGVTELWKSAFCYCSALESIVLPDGLTRLNSYAFCGCSALREITLPDTVRSIGYQCFTDCTALARVQLPAGWEVCPSYSDSNSGPSYQGGIFKGCSALKTVSLPKALTRIPDYAFCNCESLTEIETHEELEAIGAYAFYNCSALLSISIPASVTQIAENTFSGCSSLLVVNIPEAVTDVGKNAFRNCDALQSIHYEGDETGWAAISKNTSGNGSLDGAEISYHSRGGFEPRNYLGAWEGEYDGNHNSIVVRRHFVCVIQSVDMTTDTLGKIHGTITFSPSDAADAAYAQSGEYYFDGTINTATGSIFMQGHTWIVHPEMENFDFVTFAGFLNPAKTTFYGINQGVSYRTFYADNIAYIRDTNTGVTLTSEGQAYDLLREPYLIAKDSDEVVTITVTPDWEGAAPGVITLNQDDKSIESKTGVFFEIRPGTVFDVSKSFYVVLFNAQGDPVQVVRPKLSIVHRASSRSDASLNASVITVYAGTENGKAQALAAGTPQPSETTFFLTKGATITYNGKTYDSDSRGRVKIDDQISGNITVSKKGYVSRTLTPEQCKNTPNVYLRKTSEKKPVISGVWIDNTDVMHYPYVIYADKQDSYTVTAEIDWGKSSYGTVKLWQDGRELVFTNGVLSSRLSDTFDLSKTVLIVATDANGRSRAEKLKLKASELPESVGWLNGAGFDLGDSISLTLPDSVPFFGGGKVSTGIESALPITFIAEDGVIYAAIGVDLVHYSYSDKKLTHKNKNSYHTLKRETTTFIDKFKSIPENGFLDPTEFFNTTTRLKNLKKEYKKAILKKQGSFGFDADFTILGFMEGTYDSNGVIRWTDTGVILNPSVSWSWGLQTSIGPVPTYLEAKITGSVSARLNLLMNDQAKQVKPFGTIDGKLGAEAGGGVGLSKVVGIGGGGGGSFSPSWTLRFNEKDYLKLGGELHLYFKAYLGPFEYKKDFPLAEGTILEYPSKYKAAPNANPGTPNPYDTRAYALTDLTYLNAPSAFITARSTAKAAAAGTSTVVFKDNVFAQTKPQLVTFENGTMLAVWQDADQASMNDIQLLYSFFDGNTWSDPAPVLDDGTLDLAPTLKCVNDTAYLVWQNASKPFSETAELDDMAPFIDVATGVFSPESGFTVRTIETDGADVLPTVCADADGAAAVWVNNPDGKWFCDGSENRIMTAPITPDASAEAEALYEGLNPVLEVAADDDQGMHIAYVVDTDGDLQTTEDLRVFIDGAQKPIRDAFASGVSYVQHKLCYFTKEGFVALGELTDAPMRTDRYQIITSGDAITMLWAEPTEGGAVLKCASYDKAKACWWVMPDLTTEDEYVTDYCGAYNADGTLRVLFNTSKVSRNADGAYELGSARLKLCTSTTYCNLSLSDLEYQADEFVSGCPMTVVVPVRNAGTTTVSGYDITITSGGAQLASFTTNCPLLPGETSEDPISFLVPEGITQLDIAATVTPHDAQQADGAVGTITEQIRYEDIAVEDLFTGETEDGKTILYASIANRGYCAQSDLVVSLRKDTADGTVLKTVSIPAIAEMNVEPVAFDVTDLDLSVAYLTVSSDTDDLPGNNSAFLPVRPASDPDTVPCEHAYTESGDSTAPGCEAQGLTLYVCEKCGDAFAESTPALGHDWSEPEYIWSDDNTSVTATRTCGRDDSHTEQETVQTTAKVLREATEQAEGEMSYTAAFENPAFAAQTKKVSIPRLTPTPGDPTKPSDPPTPTTAPEPTASPKPDEKPKPDTPTPRKNPFVDVSSDQYYYDPVLWALDHDPQITDGTSETTFSPNDTCTRGQVVTFLWRAMGCAEPTKSDNPFTDVHTDDYFYKAVLWAVEKGITDGTSATTFSPNDPCTRAHVVTILWRSEGKPAAGSANPFRDVGSGEYFTDAVLWAVKKGITDGTSETTFSPADPCTRGQIVTFLYRDRKA